MEKDILHAIVGVEREIQERLVAEQVEADKRLAQVRRACEEAAAREETRLQEDLATTVAQAGGEEAQKQAAAIIAAAAAQAERLGRLNDDSLRRLVLEELSRLVPGRKS